MSSLSGLRASSCLRAFAVNHEDAKTRRVRKNLSVAALSLLLLASCRQDMHDQPKYEPLEESPFFEDGRSARPLLPETVPRGYLREDAHLYTGKAGNADAETFPFPITGEVLERGRERFNIFCSVCHGRLGDGEGMIARRGFRRPPSYHIVCARRRLGTSLT